MTTTDDISERPYTCHGGGGCSGTTPVWVKKLPNGSIEARCGFALLGMTQMTESEFKACEYNPFHPEFMDNYSVGIGATEQDALDALKTDMKSIGDSLWL